MKYKGIELKEITEPQVFNPPKEMLVWDDSWTDVESRLIFAIIKRKEGIQAIGCVCRYMHCAEITEDPKQRRATNRELSKWLAMGNGECISSQGHADTAWMYDKEISSNHVVEWAKVRKWDDTDWHEPTVDYMGLEGDK